MRRGGLPSSFKRKVSFKGKSRYSYLQITKYLILNIVKSVQKCKQQRNMINMLYVQMDQLLLHNICMIQRLLCIYFHFSPLRFIDSPYF